jgi:hypothetical protein
MTKAIEPKGLSWVTDKKMHWDEPWFEVEIENFMQQGNTLHTQVIKNYKLDMTAQYAAFMVHSFSDATTGGEAMRDSGDEYIANVMRGELVKVMGREPTAEEHLEFASIRNRAVPSGW